MSIDAESSAGLYLGCTMTRGKMKLPNGVEATTHTYDMENYLKMSVKKYLDLAGPGTKMKKVVTWMAMMTECSPPIIQI